MIKSSQFLIIIGLSFFCASLTKATEEDLKLVTTTGRAAIVSDEQMQETRTRALEDALYNAALLGGAEIDGFSSVQASTHKTLKTLRYVSKVSKCSHYPRTELNCIQSSAPNLVKLFQHDGILAPEP